MSTLLRTNHAMNLREKSSKTFSHRRVTTARNVFELFSPIFRAWFALVTSAHGKSGLKWLLALGMTQICVATEVYAFESRAERDARPYLSPNPECRSADQKTTASFSALARKEIDCTPSIPHAATNTMSVAKSMKHEPFDEDWLKMEMVSVSIIYLAQLKDGAHSLSDVWFAGAILAPSFMTPDPEYGMKKNYLAVTPALAALGMLNEYLYHDGAAGSRIFLSNVIGYNLALQWSHAVLSDPKSFLGSNERGTTFHLTAAPHEIGSRLTWRW